MELSSPKSKKFLTFKEGFPKLKKPKVVLLSRKSYEQIFTKSLLNNSFHLFYKLKQTKLLVYKHFESFHLR